MKHLCCFLFIVSLLNFVACYKIPTQSSLDSGGNVPVKISIKIDRIKGIFGSDSQAVRLKTLLIKIYVVDADTIYDMFPINDEHFSILQGYYLKPLRNYTLEAFTVDNNDSITHTGSRIIPVRNEYEEMWGLDLLPRYCMLQAKIFPLSKYPKAYGELTECEMKVDNISVAEVYDLHQSMDDTVHLYYNYATLNKEHEITLNVYGSYFNDGYLLYSGSIKKTLSYSYEELEPFSIPLKWVGPETIPSVYTGFSAYVMPVQKQIIKGEIETPPVHY